MVAALPPIQATGSKNNLPEPTKIDQSTYQIIGTNTGKVYGTGTGDTPEAKLVNALATQTQLSSGGTPTVSGRPDLYAIAPTAAEGAPQAIAGADGKPVMPKVATSAQLGQAATGTLESFNKATGVQPAPSGPSGATLLSAPPAPPTNFADASKAAIAAGVEAKKQSLLGAPDSYDNQIANQKAALLTKLTGQDLTPEDLKWLTPAQSNAILSGDEQLIRAELTGLASISTSRREAKAAEEERANAQFQKYLDSGVDPSTIDPAFLSDLDSRLGMPEGFHEAYLKSDYAKDELEKQSAQLTAATQVMSAVNSMQVGGPPLTIGDTTYSMLNYGDSVTGTESGGTGQYLWTQNQTTGETTVRRFGPPTNMDYKDFPTDQGQVVRVYSDGSKFVFDPTQPDFGVPNPEALQADFPDGFKPTDADLAAMGLTQLNPGTGGIQCGQYYRLTTGYTGGDLTYFDTKKALIDPSIGTATNPPQAGDAFIQAGGTYGHIGTVLGSTLLEDGSYQISITDANAQGTGTVRYTTLNSKNVLGFARLTDGLAPEYAFGSDASSEGGGATETGATSGGQKLTFTGQDPDAAAVEVWAGKVASGEVDISSVPSDIRNRVVVASASITPESKSSEGNTQLLSQLDTIRNHSGLNNAVGHGLASRPALFGIGSANKDAFISQVENLTDALVLDKLIEAKASGAAFGALSDSELQLLSNAASRLSHFEKHDPKDPTKIVGYDTSQEEFNVALDEIQKYLDPNYKGSGTSSSSANTDQYSAYRSQLKSGDILVKDAAGAIYSIPSNEYNASIYTKI